MAKSEHFFGAAMSAQGFVSRFDALFSPTSGEWQKIYIIKGGPGTGKSSFMRVIGEAAERRGLRVEYVLCSSDPCSLDGIRIPERGVAFLDGTAPHLTDPVYPGAVEEIINMGMYFDRAALEGDREAIKTLQNAYASEMRLASRYLQAAGALRQGLRQLADRAFLSEKARGAAVRWLSGCRTLREPRTEVRYLSANSTKGLYHLTGPERRAARVVYVDDGRGLSSFVLGALFAAAEERGVSYIRYPDPLLPEETEGLYLPDTDTLYMTNRYLTESTEGQKTVNADRFFAPEGMREIRSRLRFGRRCVASVMEGAYETLSGAGRLHDALERHYVSAMDFGAQAAFAKRLTTTVFGEG